MVVSCPKMPRLRTQESLFGCLVSEDSQTSDTIELIWLSGVRRCQDFGQGRAYLVVWCPKIPQLRTQESLFGCLVSEDPPTSDTIEPIWLFRVRRCPDFGHKRAYLVVSCPKMPRLRTQESLFGCFVSEDTQTSDTTPLFSTPMSKDLPTTDTTNKKPPQVAALFLDHILMQISYYI